MNAGQVVGRFYNVDSGTGEAINRKAFIWDRSGSARLLSTLSGEWYPVAINDSGMIGSHLIVAANESLPYYWPNKSSAPFKITMPTGFPCGKIYGINASGQMVGILWSSDQADVFRPHEAIQGCILIFCSPYC